MTDTLLNSRPAVLDRLQTLADATRARLLVLLEKHEFTVSDLCAATKLPQSTVSRHLKVLADDGWVRSRPDGTSRHYRVADDLADESRQLWALVRDSVAESGLGTDDAARATELIRRKLERSRAFFSDAASDWSTLRADLFGPGARLAPLLGVLRPDWTVADLGTGRGDLAALVAPWVERVIAVDASPEMLEQAAERSRRNGAGGLDLRQGQLEELPVASASVDLAFLVLVLHHVVDPVVALAEARRVLKPDGTLVVVDLQEHDQDEYAEGMGHQWLGFSRERMERWAREAGFEDARIVDLEEDPDAKGPPLFVASLRGRHD